MSESTIPPGTRLITWGQFAEKLGVCDNTARSIAKRGGLVPVLVGRRTRIVEHEADALIAALPREPRAMPKSLAAARGASPAAA